MTDWQAPAAREAPGDSTGGTVRSQVPIPTGPAFVTWLSAWLIANLITVPAVVLMSGAEPSGMSPAISLVALAVQWTTFLVAVVFVSRQFGTGSLRRDLGARMRPIDLVGVPIGVLMQAVVVPVMYWPLRELWPDAFSPEALEERSRSLIGGAGGIALVLITIGVIVGAPLVEELVYRGLLQRSFSLRLGGVGAWILTSALFAAVHFSFVDALGLFAAGLVFGAGVLITGRIGFGVFAHLGFNGFAMIVLLATR